MAKSLIEEIEQITKRNKVNEFQKNYIHNQSLVLIEIMERLDKLYAEN